MPFSTETKIPRYLDDGNAEDWAHSLSCGFCKTNLSLGDRGVIQSPDYPQAYTANVDCLWLLETANLEDRIYLDCDSVELGNTSNPILKNESHLDHLQTQEIARLSLFKCLFPMCGRKTVAYFLIGF